MPIASANLNLAKNCLTLEKLLNLLEEKVKTIGIKYIWTWTASYEAETFYLKQGYKIFTRFEDYFPNNHSRVGLIKKL